MPISGVGNNPSRGAGRREKSEYLSNHEVAVSNNDARGVGGSTQFNLALRGWYGYHWWTDNVEAPLT